MVSKIEEQEQLMDELQSKYRKLMNEKAIVDDALANQTVQSILHILIVGRKK
jgi:hypothetical protein